MIYVYIHALDGNKLYSRLSISTRRVVHQQAKPPFEMIVASDFEN